MKLIRTSIARLLDVHRSEGIARCVRTFDLLHRDTPSVRAHFTSRLALPTIAFNAIRRALIGSDRLRLSPAFDSHSQDEEEIQSISHI